MRNDTESCRDRLPFRWSTLLVLEVWAITAAILLLTTVLPWRPVGILAGGIDLAVYREGAHRLLVHESLYSGPVVFDYLYTYPPFSTVVFLPLRLLPSHQDKYYWMAANFVVLVVIVAQCWRMLGYRITRYLATLSVLLAVVFTFIEPVRTTLFFGQINLVLMLLVLWDTGRGEHSRLKGIGVGIAAGIKLTPAYFVVYYLALRQWRAAARASAAIAATVGVGWILLEDDSRQYWAHAFVDSKRIANDPLHPGNQSLWAAIARLSGGAPPSATSRMPGQAPPTWVWLLAAAGVAAASMWIAVVLYRNGERLLAVTVTGLSSVVVSPFSWSHHWVWFVPLIVFLVHRGLTNRWWWLGALGLFVLLGSWPYWFPVDTEPRIGFYLFPAPGLMWDALVNLYLLIYAAVMAAAAVIAIRGRRERPQSGSSATASIAATPASF